MLVVALLTGDDSHGIEESEPATYQAAEQRNQDRLDLEGHGGNN